MLFKISIINNERKIRVKEKLGNYNNDLMLCFMFSDEALFRRSLQLFE